MIVYQCNAKWAMTRVHKRWVKMRVSNKNARRDTKVYRRIWFWHEDKWDQRHGIDIIVH